MHTHAQCPPSHTAHPHTTHKRRSYRYLVVQPSSSSSNHRSTSIAAQQHIHTQRICSVHVVHTALQQSKEESSVVQRRKRREKQQQQQHTQPKKWKNDKGKMIENDSTIKRYFLNNMAASLCLRHVHVFVCVCVCVIVCDCGWEWMRGTDAVEEARAHHRQGKQSQCFSVWDQKRKKKTMCVCVVFFLCDVFVCDVFFVCAHGYMMRCVCVCVEECVWVLLFLSECGVILVWYLFCAIEIFVVVAFVFCVFVCCVCTCARVCVCASEWVKERRREWVCECEGIICIPLGMCISSDLLFDLFCALQKSF